MTSPPFYDITFKNAQQKIFPFHICTFHILVFFLTELDSLFQMYEQRWECSQGSWINLQSSNLWDIFRRTWLWQKCTKFWFAYVWLSQDFFFTISNSVRSASITSYYRQILHPKKPISLVVSSIVGGINENNSIVNKNAFQCDAYGGGVPAQWGVPAWGLYLPGGVPARGVYLAREAVPAQGVPAPVLPTCEQNDWQTGVKT